MQRIKVYDEKWDQKADVKDSHYYKLFNNDSLENQHTP